MVHCFLQSYRILPLIWLFLIQIPLIPTAVGDDLTVFNYVPNFLTVDYSRDNDHGRSTYVSANLGLTYKDRLLVGIGEDVQTLSGSEEDLDNKTYLLGYSYIPGSRMQFGAEYERWGDSSKVTVDTIRLNLAFRGENFAVLVTPDYRKINVDNESQCDTNIYSHSVSVGLIIDINSELSFNIGHVPYKYSDNLTELGDCVDNAEELEVKSRIDSVADDSLTYVGLDYYLDSETYGANASQSETALFGLNSKTLSVYVSTDRYDDWTLTATAGITDNTDDSTSTFITGTVTYYW